MSPAHDDRERGALAALLALPKLGPARLRALLDRFGTATEAVDAVGAGRLGDVDLRCHGSTRTELVAAWRAALRGTEPEALVERHRSFGVRMVLPGDDAWPSCFQADPEPPVAVFLRGDATLLARPSVAIVGTRRCSAMGAGVAREMGRDLAEAGVAVCSGLALGIDGAAHVGALAGGGRPIGVVATGLDVVYPRRHARLWSEVADRGVLLTEAPLGTPAERWRFPARNRLIASLASVVVVVESRAEGGSMHTVSAAIERQTEVLAVPGPVRAPMSAGPNQLLHEGCGVVRDAADVLVALGWETAVHPRAPSTAPVALGPDESEVSRVVGWTPMSLEAIAAAAGLAFPRVAAALASLELADLVEQVDQGYQRVTR